MHPGLNELILFGMMEYNKMFFFAKIFIAFELFDIHTKFSKEGLIIHFFFGQITISEKQTPEY